MQFEKALLAAGFVIKEQLIWDKGMVLGHSDYHWAHEPILYCRKKDKNCVWHGDRAQKTLFKADMSAIKNLKKEELLFLIEKARNGSTIWTIKKDSHTSYVHPTQKPVELSLKAINNSSIAGNTVLEPFCGSGSTLIGCEISGRKCRAIELDAYYCDIIIQRWCDYTNQDEIKINGKKVKWSEYVE